MADPTRDGRWGIRQVNRHGENCGGTINLGWLTREEAEQSNPPMAGYAFEPFERWPEPQGNGSEAEPQ